ISADVREGSFQKDLETFLSDQFPLREALVYLQTGIRYISGQREIGGAYLCGDGRLIQKITQADIDKAELRKYAGKINKLTEICPVYVLYVPSAGAVPGNLLPAGAPTYDYTSLYEDLVPALGRAKSLNLSDYLTDGKYYYKTDHHWNAQGAYLGYRAFCDLKGEEPREMEEYHCRMASPDFRGTLSSMVPVLKSRDEILLPEVPETTVTADGNTIDFYDEASLAGKDKYNVFQGGNHGILEIENKEYNNTLTDKINDKEGKTLLILKDSFANSFVPYIVRDYSRIIMIDERYSFLGLTETIQQIRPDEILVIREIIH
ncbi:MAG: hypothetical protein IKX76_07240, partial [Eubacterium sp.]|nr:hypothetical protein [Eubacterium sp.]